MKYVHTELILVAVVSYFFSEILAFRKYVKCVLLNETSKSKAMPVA